MKKVLLAMILLPTLLFASQWQANSLETNAMSEITRGYIICDTIQDVIDLREATKRQIGWHRRHPGGPPALPRYEYEFGTGTEHEDSPTDLRHVAIFDTNKGTREESLEGLTRYTTRQIEDFGFLINIAPDSN